MLQVFAFNALNSSPASKTVPPAHQTVLTAHYHQETPHAQPVLQDTTLPQVLAKPHSQITKPETQAVSATARTSLLQLLLSLHSFSITFSEDSHEN